MSSKSLTEVVVPAFEPTLVETIPALCERVRAAFRSNKTKSVEWRKVQLRKLYWAVEDYTPQLVQALKQDLNKSEYETVLTEVSWVKNDIMFMLNNLDWMAKDEALGRPHVPLLFQTNGIRYRKEPLGAVLVIGAYNYPIQLSLSPFVGAIAAGCSAVLKPSENAPATAAVLRELVEKRLDWTAFAVVNGAVPETSALLEEKWAKIFYTGGINVGKIIARKAAETLTPVTLELGGRNPAFVTRNANIRIAARRLMWGNTMNAGQICLSPNYVLIERSVVDEFVAGLKQAYQELMPRGARNSELCKIINERQFLRMKRMLDESKGKIVMGGQVDQAALFIEPTAVLVDSVEDSMMAEESFGPIFAVMPFDKLDDAINIANKVDPTPLALYTFGSDAENAKVLDHCNSGGASMNDCIAHGQITSVAFGGVGTSGTGSYRGKASFDTFTHLRTIAKTPYWMEGMLKPRYMPYNFADLKFFLRMTGSKPNFDRNGKVVRGLGYWLGLILSLGGSRGSGSAAAKGALRWLLVLLAGYIGMYGLTPPQKILLMITSVLRR